MDSIKATWRDGQIMPAEPVDWPDGSELIVERIGPAQDKIGLTEEEWGDDPESIAAWIAKVEKLEPMVWGDGEREEYERYREISRQYNLSAVRKQMEEVGDGDTP